MVRETQAEAHIIKSPVSGTAVPLEEVGDEVLASGMLGAGSAVVPSSGSVFSPCDGRIVRCASSKHAFCMVTDDGIELLVHFGIDTVRLRGDAFSMRVSAGDSVAAGDLVMRVDLDAVRAAGYDPVTSVIVTNPDSLGDVRSEAEASSSVEAGDPLLAVTA